MDDADERFMRRALDLAERGRHTVSPNPLVGCVVVDAAGQVVGEGWHRRAGGPHAEVVALAEAGPRASGATVYVTLEPCAHTGRTGPCTTILLDAGVSRVVAALPDPNPAAAGGVRRLREAGVRVDVGVCEGAARRQNEVFLHAVATGRPFVVVKAAVSLDGRIAAADGTSQWLTGEAARRAAHILRAEVDAVLVGSGTVLADDPQLTCRLPGYEGPQPLRVVLDRRGRVPPDARVRDDAAPTLVLDEPDLKAALQRVWDEGARSVLVEGGTGVLTGMLAAGLVDKLVVHVAPVLLGQPGRPLVGDLGVASLPGARRFRLDSVEQVDGDAVLVCYPVAPGEAVSAGEEA